MTGKFLGKITSAEFGSVRDYPFLIGLQLTFKTEIGNCGCGGKYTVNISEDCKWEETERETAIITMIEKVDDMLSDAKANYVSELKGKPVEVTFKNNTFKDFRILTEVL